MIIYLIVIFALVAIDQYTKHLAVINLMGKRAVEVFPKFFYLNYTENTGAAWSIFEGKMGIFYVVTLFAIGIFVYFLIKEGDFANKKILTISILLLISGTIGNFIDRILKQHVVDFLQFFPFGYSFPIFNVADMCLTIGTIGFAATVLLSKN